MISSETPGVSAHKCHQCLLFNCLSVMALPMFFLFYFHTDMRVFLRILLTTIQARPTVMTPLYLGIIGRTYLYVTHRASSASFLHAPRICDHGGLFSTQELDTHI